MSVREWVLEARQDGAYAVRQLLRNRGFAAVAVITLSLGIGATTAIFSVVQGVLLRPLPFPGADRLLVPQSQSRENPSERWNITYADFEDWRREGVFARVAAFQEISQDMTGEGVAPKRVEGAVVTEDFFATLGVAPALGRFPLSEDHQPGSPAVIVISHALWLELFSGDRTVLGRSVRVSGVPFQIIGVVPAGLGWPREADMWVPSRLGPQALEVVRRRSNYIYFGVARLAPGRSLEETRALLDAQARRVAATEPDGTRDHVTVTARRLDSYLVGEDVSRGLWLLLGAVALVLLISCVNVANLLSVRSSTRVREMSIRRALGAGSRRLVRQLLTESLVLSLVGAGVGAMLAWAGLRSLLGMAPSSLPRLEDVRLDAGVLGFALIVSIAAALVFGVVPAIHASRSAGAGVLRSENRATSGRRARRVRDVLVVSELALSLVLFVGAGLFLRSFGRLRNVEAGVETENLLTFSLSLPRRYNESGGFAAPFAAIVERVRAVPGVRSAALASALPLGGGGFYLGRSFLSDTMPEPPAGSDVTAQWTAVSPGYFETAGTRVLRGREFEQADGASGRLVMIVNRAFAREMFGDEAAAIGKRVRSWRDENQYREIVGVTEDVRYFAAGDSIRRLVYVPHAQNAWGGMRVLLRTSASPLGVEPALREAVGRVDPELAVADLTSMEQVFADSVAPQRFGALLLSGFALLAALLAAVGIFGVLSYAVALRTREIGVRIALGAEQRTVLGMVLSEATVVIVLGVVIGGVGALLLSRMTSSLLFETSATDPLTFIGTAVLLAAIALAASYLPARRATRVNPLDAIRAE
jgi:predicted permease